MELINFIVEKTIENKTMLTLIFSGLILEIFLKKRMYLNFKIKEIKNNIGIHILNEYVFIRPLIFIIFSIILIAIQKKLGGFADSIAIFKSLPAIWGYILIFPIYDALQFHIHLMFHNNRILWNFHKVHHSLRHINVTADSRFHIVESACFIIFAEIPLVLLGFSIEQIAVKGIFFQAMSIFLHMDCKYTFPTLTKFFPTPQSHLWHHSYDKITKFSQQNIGSLFNGWDRIYGTYYYNNEYPDKLGFEGVEKFPEGVFGQLIYGVKHLFDSNKNETN